ncbi:MAG: hypothetical protein OM95_03555 [Bdellovibrio sp. ArHS]|uniref:hypothetical protein n=1 Tax=Bdellovibrio sp. ArHS TaxID=1569284 RepID=UPI00058362C4|nr:hypothetical protein [Bdellovibrio sp. ArHS]KHD89452.1 MAG: hypothetical protein OM95_03555 [Bdellovibrio sp. ArHS]
MSSRLVKGTVAVVAVSGIVVAFQNCSSQGFDTEGAALSASSSNFARGGGVSVPGYSSGGYYSEPSLTNKIQVVASSTAVAKEDCSKAGSEIHQVIKNAPSSISVCAEYILDMPAGHPRYNEQSFCDRPEKFAAPNLDQWSYDASLRQWSTRTPYKVNDDDTIVPGSYWLVVRDHTGEIFRSGEILVKRTGFGHCQSGIVVNGASTEAARVDCSLAGAAIINQTVQNAPMDVQVCSEYTLDMPPGHPRYGESFKCDSASKFRYLFPEWSYNSATRTFTHPTAVFNLSGNPVIVPGTYRTVVRDPATGKVFQSANIVVKRPGYGDCAIGSKNYGGSTGTRCSWSGIVAGPESSPTASCSTANKGAKATNDRGTVFTCQCS